MEPKPNEPRGDTFLPTVGHALAFISTLDQPEMVGVNPDVAHETMAGLNVHHGVAQAIDAGKLFHIDLNAQQVGRYDQDLRFGSEGLKEAFFLVKLLEESGYDGPRHFDARPYRVEDTEGAWDFAVGCMRTYLALAAKARRFADDPQIQDALEECGATTLADATIGCYPPMRLRRPRHGGVRPRGPGKARLPQRTPRPTRRRTDPRPPLGPRGQPGVARMRSITRHVADRVLGRASDR